MKNHEKFSGLSIKLFIILLVLSYAGFTLAQTSIEANPKNWTEYHSKATFNSIANNMEIPVTAICKILAHERLSTTQEYQESRFKPSSKLIKEGKSIA